MNSTRLALLALIVGLVAGIGAGFVLGSKPQTTIAAADTTIDRSSSIGRADSGPRSRALDEPNRLAHVDAQAAPLSSGATNGDADDGAARAASSVVMGRVAATVAGDGKESWTGTITGSVLDADGNAVHGATVVTPNRAGRYGSRGKGTDTNTVGRNYSGPVNVNESLERQAKALLEGRRNTRTVTTDASGHFELTGLRPQGHSLSVHSEDLVFSAQTIHVGESARFIGRPVALFRLDIRLPDGTSPAEATVLVGDQRRSTSYMWTEGEPVLRFKEQSATMTVLAGNVEAIEWRKYTSDFSSEERTIDLARDGEGPHVIELEPRRMLRVTLEDASGVEPRLKAWVKALRAEKAEGAELAAAFEDAPKLVRGDGLAYTLSDLDPGAYLVAAGRGAGEPEVTAKVEIGEGVSEQHLVLGDVDMGRYLVVSCSGPDGTGLVSVSFQRMVRSGNGSTTGGANAIGRGPGEFWIPHAALLNNGEWSDDTEVELTADAKGYGKIVSDLGPRQTTLELEFASSCELTVRVEGDLTPGFSVGAERVEDNEDPNARFYRSARNTKKVNAEGVAQLTGLQPGLMRVVLRKADGRNRGWSEPIATQELTVRAGSNVVSFVAPTFHEVVIHAPDLEKGTNFWLQKDDPGASNFYGRNSAELDATLRATFKDVAAGQYIVRTWGGGSDGQMKITVPSGEIIFEADTINAFIATSVQAGKLCAKGGLLDGDVVVAVNGKQFEGNDFYQRLMIGLKDGTVTLSIYRGSTPMDISIGPSENATKAWEEMGVGWQPTSR